MAWARARSHEHLHSDCRRFGQLSEVDLSEVQPALRGLSGEGNVREDTPVAFAERCAALHKLHAVIPTCFSLLSTAKPCSRRLPWPCKHHMWCTPHILHVLITSICPLPPPPLLCCHPEFRQEMLAMAPDTEDVYVRVPKITTEADG